MNPGDRVLTPNGPGSVVGPWLSRGLSRHGDLRPEGWIVALDEGRRRVFLQDELQSLIGNPEERGNDDG